MTLKTPRRIRRALCVAVASSALLSITTIATASVASANPCGTNHYGSTWYSEYGGYSTTYYYATCSNLTVQNVYNTDFYEGYYYSSSQGWIEGSGGEIKLYSESQPNYVFANSIISGTAEKIWSLESDTGVNWWN